MVGAVTAPDLLALIVERAPALRAAGVLSVAIDGFSVTLAPAEPEATDDKPSDDDERWPGEKLPGYTLDPPVRVDRSE